MSALLKFLFFACLFGLISNQSTTWQSWNDEAASPSFVPSPIPPQSPPAGWARVKNSPSLMAMFPLSERRNQYRFFYPNNFGQTCTFICGPRSFLKKDVYNGKSYYYCQRDTNTRYWGSSALNQYPSKCYPDVSVSGQCIYFSGYSSNFECTDSLIPVTARDAGVTKCCYNSGAG